MIDKSLRQSASPHILLTGATGFVGRALMEHIVASTQCDLTVSVRSTSFQFPPSVKVVEVGSLSEAIDWSDALREVSTVVHLAARAHILCETSLDPLADFRQVNVDATLSLARQALAMGVRRFVFISSIGVNGTFTINEPFTEKTETLPHAYYAISKLEAERGLQSLCKDSDMELVIVRPPLVYAGHAPGNFARLLKLVTSGIPLPLASVTNKRSMIALENLVDFISLCVGHPLAGNQVFLISDGEDLSTPSMLRYLAEGMDKSNMIFSMPVCLMQLGAKVLRRQLLFNQLCGSLVIDSSKARDLLNWVPPISVASGLRNAARDYIKNTN